MLELQRLAITLLNNGFIPIPIPRESKAPKVPGWQTDIPSEDRLIRAFARPSNMGVRCGDMQDDSTCLLALDLDYESHQLIRCVERAIGERVPVKRGKKGYTYFIRLDRPQKTHKIYWTRDEKKTAAIDVLCIGAQTVIPPSIHPDTKQPYHWVAGTPLDQINYRDLPVFSPTVIDEIRGFAKNPDDPIHALNDMEWCGVGGGGNTHDTCVAAVGSMVVRQWPEEDIHARIQRAKHEACQRAGMPYDWPKGEKVIQEWIDSARVNFPVTQRKTRKLSHRALADAFVEDTQPNIRYDWQKKCWYTYSTTYWEPGQDHAVRHQVERYLPVELANRSVVEGVVNSLRDRPDLVINQESWDPDPFLMNTPDGTVDLRTGKLQPACPSDLITRCTEVAPDWSGPPVLWESKLPEWFGDEPSTLDYVQVLGGYCCTGETREHCLPLWIGPGGDGKSVITGIIAHVLGSYAGVASDTAFLDTRYSQHSEELAMLHPFRLVRVSEMSGPWREDRIKQVTGGESITSSFKNAHLFTYTPRFKLLVTANEPPRLRSVGRDMSRRFHVYKFTRGVREIDTHLPDRLRQEGGRILAWLIAGAVKYYQSGLPRCEAVEAATAEYFIDNDMVQQWIADKAELGNDFRVEQAAAYENFRFFLEEHGVRNFPTRSEFQRKLVAKGIIKKNAVVKSGSAPVPALIGIRLKSETGGPYRDF